MARPDRARTVAGIAVLLMLPVVAAVLLAGPAAQSLHALAAALLLAGAAGAAGAADRA
jgi:hypothetical protein